MNVPRPDWINYCVICGWAGVAGSCPNCYGDRGLRGYVPADQPAPIETRPQGAPDDKEIVAPLDCTDEPQGAPRKVCTCGAGSDEDCSGPSDHVPGCPAGEVVK